MKTNLYNVASQFNLNDLDEHELLLTVLNLLICRPDLPDEGQVTELCQFMNDWQKWERVAAMVLRTLER